MPQQRKHVRSEILLASKSKWNNHEQMHNKYNHFWSYIALVLDLPVPVDVVDGVGTVGGDPGDGLEALVGEETLTIVGWIEEKKNIFLCLVQLHEELACRARLG